MPNASLGTIEHVIFDVDGTLIDPWIGMTQSVAYAFAKLGRSFHPDSTLRILVGPPLKNCFEELLQTHDETLISEALRLYRERFAAVGISECRLYDGVSEMLEVLSHSQHLYVATARLHHLAEMVLEHFGITKYFHGVYGTGPEGKFDDKADQLSHIVGTHKLDPEKCVMIGDRKHDVIAARANNIHAIAVTYGYGSAQELSAAGAHYLAANPQGVCELLA